MLWIIMRAGMVGKGGGGMGFQLHSPSNVHVSRFPFRMLRISVSYCLAQ